MINNERKNREKLLNKYLKFYNYDLRNINL